MDFSPLFFINSILFGVGLAMDAFSVSIANAISNPYMKKKMLFEIAGMFGLFQFLMPLIGWTCVHFIAKTFEKFSAAIPWIALVLLLFLGIKMIVDTVKNKDEGADAHVSGFGNLILQAFATSIDALSVGFTIAELELGMALTESLIIGIVTFGICMAGLFLGKKIGTKLNNAAGIVGGVILILIGLEIFFTGVF